jgi:AraC-like DNA-binding protein
VRRKWFYRLLFSYTPIFFVTIAVLIFITYFNMNQQFKRQIVSANHTYAQQTMQMLDSLLSSIEKLAVNEAMNDPRFRMIFEGDPAPISLYDQYQLGLKLDQMKNAFSIIDSIYMYSDSSKMVITNQGVIPVSDFADRQFIESIYAVGNTKWLNPRPFQQESADSKPKYVVSLSKSAPIASYKQGVLVVNADLDSIISFLRDSYKSPYGYLDLLDSDGRSFFTFDSTGLPENTRTFSSAPYSVQVHSNYSNWYMQSGLRDNAVVGSFFAVTNIWTIAGVLIILFGIAWLTYVTHRNYKPISNIVENIEKFTSNKGGRSGLEIDEMALIENTLASLMLNSSEHEKQLKKDLYIKQKHLLMEVLEGNRMISADAWRQELHNLEIRKTLDQPFVAVLEIDQYLDFVNHFTVSDQYLFKYILQKVMMEFSEANKTECWAEWMEPNRMVALLQPQDTSHDPAAGPAVKELCNRTRAWVQENLTFTVSIAIGDADVATDNLSYSYHEAVEALQYKAALGKNRVIAYSDIATQQKGEIYNYLQDIRDLVKSYKLSEDSWRHQFNQLFGNLANDCFTKTEMSSLLSYLNYQLQKEIMELGDAFQLYWREEAQPRLNLLEGQAETVGEVRIQTEKILLDLEAGLKVIRENRSSHQLINTIREYIDENYDDPNLSLDQLSGHFGMSTRYISRLFKEEYGETLIGYVTDKRIGKAKLLLETTEDMLQDIVEKVGYLNPSSFIRVFRKATGTTPGDYRRKWQK